MSGSLESLRGRRILVAEDEYAIADELAEVLGDAGAEVVGPVSRIAEALDIALSDQPLDGAVLDVNLAGELIWPVVDALAVRGVPLVLASGYDEGMIPARHADLLRCQKPTGASVIVCTLGQSIARYMAKKT